MRDPSRLAFHLHRPYRVGVNFAQKAKLEKAVWVDVERVTGAPCFRDTRVPVQSLFDLLEAGETVDDFLRLTKRSRKS